MDLERDLSQPAVPGPNLESTPANRPRFSSGAAVALEQTLLDRVLQAPLLGHLMHAKTAGQLAETDRALTLGFLHDGLLTLERDAA